MELWRISIYTDLSGVGGLLAKGRWHTKGKLVVYLADHSSSALLERLAHIDPDELPLMYQLLRVQVSDAIAIAEVDVTALPADWHKLQDFTRQIGDLWLAGGTGALLRVPSAITPYASNYLLNPAHADARTMSIVETIVAPFDPRLWKK